jgi:hypothetical protein|tara:strand:+ start:433 stop:630 length:198 start_codon:yes stop_codon:yes gene_type:complete
MEKEINISIYEQEDWIDAVQSMEFFARKYKYTMVVQPEDTDGILIASSSVPFTEDEVLEEFDNAK